MSMAHDGQTLPHGYTNVTTVLGGLVTKTYRGPDAVRRQQREELAIRSVTGLLPVATIVESRPGVLVLGEVPGRHGQDLIDSGDGVAVMSGLGRLLREVQAISPVFLGESHGTGVLVHHDFGPNNVLVAEHDDSIALLADWEWSTVGRPITDLAWLSSLSGATRSTRSAYRRCSTATASVRHGVSGRLRWRTGRQPCRPGFVHGRAPRRRRRGTTDRASRSGERSPEQPARVTRVREQADATRGPLRVDGLTARSHRPL